MRYLILCAALLPGLAEAQAMPKPHPNVAPKLATSSKAKCEAPAAREVAGAFQPGIHKLGEMPPAQPIYTVLREIDGCPKPVSVGAR